MIRRTLKSCLVILLTLSIVFVPNSQVLPSQILNQAVVAYAATESTANASTTTVTYDDVKALAEKKASVLTNFYNETSVQYALIHNGKIVISGKSGVYRKNNEAALDKNCMYGIGSISKMFATVAVMQLVEQGKVSLDKPVINYIPEFSMADSRYKDITVRMLLNHSSGLMGSTFNNSFFFEENDKLGYDNFLEVLKTERLKANPGEFSVYCNDGFTLAQILVEKVAKVSFSEYIKNNISNTLNLENTRTPFDNFNRINLARAYMQGFDEALPTETLTMLGAGGLYSTAEDLCRFSELFMNNSDSKVLSAESTNNMENPEYLNGLWPQDGDSEISYGLGWDSVNAYPFNQYGIKALVKGGDTAQYHGSLVVLPEENMAIAVLSSGGSSAVDQIMAQEVLLLALKAKGSIIEIKPEKTFEKPVKVTMPQSEKSNEGIYGCFVGLVKITISDDGVLAVSDALHPEAGTVKYTYAGDSKYYYADGSNYISFVKEKNGNTYLYAFGYSRLPSLGQIADSGYQLQKLKDNPISTKVKAAWEKRSGKKYFIMNEKYSSLLYVYGAPYTEIKLLKDMKGYCMYDAIVDENHAKSNLQIPGVYGRDLIDISFYTEGNVEYLKSGGNLLISEDAIKTLPTKTSFTCNIGPNGYSHWYMINKQSAKRCIKVTGPDQGSYTVYDKNGHCVFNSMISKKTKVALPEDGYIVFVGTKGASFSVKYVK